MADEIWVTKTGQRIPVGEMSEDHVRNALRMILRNRRNDAKKRIERLSDVPWGDIDPQDILHAQAMRDLANPNAFFPLLDGGVYGSPELYRKYAR